MDIKFIEKYRDIVLKINTENAEFDDDYFIRNIDGNILQITLSKPNSDEYAVFTITRKFFVSQLIKWAEENKRSSKEYLDRYIFNK